VLVGCAAAPAAQGRNRACRLRRRCCCGAGSGRDAAQSRGPAREAMSRMCSRIPTVWRDPADRVPPSAGNGTEPRHSSASGTPTRRAARPRRTEARSHVELCSVPVGPGGVVSGGRAVGGPTAAPPLSPARPARSAAGRCCAPSWRRG